MKKGDLTKLFSPNSVAIIGASNSPQKVGYSVVHNLIEFGYRGKVYPINLKEQMILSVPAFKSIRDVPGSVDLAVIAIPSPYVLQALDDLAFKGVHHAIIISAGFGELGQEGKDLQKNILKFAKEHDIRILGPNCLGLINLTDNLNASFAGIMPKKGNIAFISQSGALCSSILSMSLEENFSFSKFISIGNKIDIDESDLLEYLGEDEATNAILIYLESINNGRRFLNTARRVGKKKPIIIIKSGTTDAGKKAASSHTGSMAGEDIVIDAAFKQAGLIRVEWLHELFDAAEIFSKVTLLENHNLAILTNGGGVGVITIDGATKAKIPLAKINKSHCEQISPLLPGHPVVGNPVDIIGDADAERFRKVLKILLRDNDIGTILTIVTPQSMTKPLETAELLIEADKSTGKLIMSSFIGEEKRMKLANDLLNQSAMPNYLFPDRAIAALSMLHKFNDFKARPETQVKLVNFDKQKARQIIHKALESGRYTLSLEEGFELLKLLDVPLPNQIFSKNLMDHKTFFNEQKSVFLKVDSPEVQHKTETKLMSGKITSEEHLIKEFERISTNNLTNWTICAQSFVHGQEIIVGGLRDNTFGPVVSVGLGGITTEIYKDVSFGIAPMSDEDAFTMLESLKAYPLLNGFRGMHKADKMSIVHLMHSIGTLLSECPEIKEIEVNPLMVGPEGGISACVDILVSLG